MENSNRIAELLAESQKGQAQMIEQIKESNMRLYNIETKSDGVEEELVKLNSQTAENSGAILKLADKIDQIADLHNSKAGKKGV